MLTTGQFIGNLFSLLMLLVVGVFFIRFAVGFFIRRID